MKCDMIKICVPSKRVIVQWTTNRKSVIVVTPLLFLCFFLTQFGRDMVIAKFSHLGVCDILKCDRCKLIRPEPTHPSLGQHTCRREGRHRTIIISLLVGDRRNTKKKRGKIIKTQQGGKKELLLMKG